MELIIGRSGATRSWATGGRDPASAFAVLATSMERFLEGSTSATAGPVSGRSIGPVDDDLDKLQCSWSNRDPVGIRTPVSRRRQGLLEGDGLGIRPKVGICGNVLLVEGDGLGLT